MKGLLRADPSCCSLLYRSRSEEKKRDARHEEVMGPPSVTDLCLVVSADARPMHIALLPLWLPICIIDCISAPIGEEGGGGREPGQAGAPDNPYVTSAQYMGRSSAGYLLGLQQGAQAAVAS